ncbi:ribonuclease H [Senna tora]|uniref:Ribonuclease H n=1 Tax=Senna tora TaxID=362788 RepID=A0A834SLH1_9FABA|nr:ribonuclease H [Senna tora]
MEMICRTKKLTPALNHSVPPPPTTHVVAYKRWNNADSMDIWLPTYAKLIDSVRNQPPENIVNMPVSCFITSSGGWDWSKIDPYVSTDVHNSIAAILPTINDRRSVSWSKIWKWPVHERIRSFIWLIAHGKILTNSHRLHRKLTDNAMCPRCGREEETALHALRDCDSVADLWMRFLNPQRWNAFFSLDLCEWIEWNRRVHVGNDISENWQTTFGVAVWHIWKNRNLIVFENHIPNMHDLFFQILYMVKDTLLCKETMGNMISKSSKAFRMIGWKPPDREKVKCNVDGSVFESTNTAGCGGVVRDASGNFIFSFGHRLGSCDIIWAELNGILDGLELLWCKGFRSVTLECDSEEALELIKNGTADNHPCSGLVHCIRDCINRCWNVDLQHVYREANRAADLMAKLSLFIPEGLQSFDAPHAELWSILSSGLSSLLLPHLCVC